MKREKKVGTYSQTTPTRGRIIVADGIYSVGDNKKGNQTQRITEIGTLSQSQAKILMWEKLGHQCQNLTKLITGLLKREACRTINFILLSCIFFSWVRCFIPQLHSYPVLILLPFLYPVHSIPLNHLQLALLKQLFWLCLQAPWFNAPKTTINTSWKRTKQSQTWNSL